MPCTKDVSLIYNAIKAAQWYSVQEGDARMPHIAS